MSLVITAVFLLLPAAATAQVAVSTAVPQTVDQVYRPANTRDPFLPATVFGDQKGPGRYRKDAPQVAVSTSAAGGFSVYGLALTGILEDSSGRQALLRDAATGEIYMLKAGRLVDSKKKAVPGVSGVVKGKQVVLMTEDKKVCQLSLPDRE